MKAAIATKGSNVVTRVALSAKLEVLVEAVACALHETASLSEVLGGITRDAGLLIRKQPEMCDPFVDGCRQMCEARGLSDGSFKVYMSNIRGVIRAMVDGFEPKKGMTLRAMYDAAPKGTGRQKATGARVTKSGEKAADAAGVGDGDESVAASYKRDGAVAAEVGVTPAEARRRAMVTLFGHADDELDAALSWAAKNELSFVRYVKANLTASAAPAAPRVATIAAAVASTKGTSTAPVGAVIAAKAKANKPAARKAA